MEMTYMYEFLKLVETGRFSDAADELFTTSSSLSKHIHALEEEYGVLLFDRTRREVTLTEFGQTFLPYAKQIVQLNQDVKTDLNKKRNHQTGCLSICSEYRIFELTTEFRHRNKQIALDIYEGIDNEKRLLKGEYELAFIVNLEDPNNEFVSIPFETDRLVMAMPKTHPLAGKANISLVSLKDEDFAMFPNPKTNKIARIIYDSCIHVGFEPNIVFTGMLGTNILDAVEQKLGIALLWEKALIPIMMDGVVTAIVEPEVTINISLCYRKDKKLSKNAMIFLDFVNDYWVKK